jgi:hypothetical protein
MLIMSSNDNVNLLLKRAEKSEKIVLQHIKKDITIFLDFTLNKQCN